MRARPPSEGGEVRSRLAQIRRKGPRGLRLYKGLRRRGGPAEGGQGPKVVRRGRPWPSISQTPEGPALKTRGRAGALPGIFNDPVFQPALNSRIGRPSNDSDLIIVAGSFPGMGQGPHFATNMGIFRNGRRRFPCRIFPSRQHRNSANCQGQGPAPPPVSRIPSVLENCSARNTVWVTRRTLRTVPQVTARAGPHRAISGVHEVSRNFARGPRTRLCTQPCPASYIDRQPRPVPSRSACRCGGNARPRPP